MKEGILGERWFKRYGVGSGLNDVGKSPAQNANRRPF